MLHSYLEIQLNSEQESTKMSSNYQLLVIPHFGNFFSPT